MAVLDVELRFVRRTVPAPEFGPDIGKEVRILQSRKLIERTWSETWVSELGREMFKSGTESSWTDWADVPLCDDPPAG